MEAEIIVATVHATVLSLPFASVFATTIVLLVNCLFQRFGRNMALSRAEVLTFYGMMATATTLFSIDTMTLLIPMIGHPFWFATPENRWAEQFHPHLPAWLTVADKDVLRGYYYGGATFWTRPILKGWLLPLLGWLVFVFLLLIVSVGLALLFSRRWIWEERLSFPLARYPLELTGSQTFQSALFWWSFFITAAMEVVNGLNALFPSVPRLKPMVDLTSLFQSEPWSAVGNLPLRFYPFVAGTVYFAPTDLSLSLWLFFVLWKVQMVIRHWRGWRFPGTYLGEQVCGSWLGLAAASLWRGRSSWIPSLSALLQNHWSAAAVTGAGASLVGFVSFVALAGMGLATGIGWTVLYWLLIIASARMRAELGPPTHELHFIGPDALLVHTLGADSFSPKTLTALSLFYWLVYGFRAHPLPTTLEMFKLAERSGAEISKMAGAAVLAGFAGAVSAPLVLLSRFYRLGGISKVQGYSIYPSFETYQRLADWLTSRPGTRWDIVRELAIGLGVSSGLTTARSFWVWFPLHPVGYTVGTGWTMSWMWFSVLVGWALKVTVLRYWGFRGYQGLMPLIVGAITGQIAVGSAWSLYGAVAGRKAYSFFP